MRLHFLVGSQTLLAASPGNGNCPRLGMYMCIGIGIWFHLHRHRGQIKATPPMVNYREFSS